MSSVSGDPERLEDYTATTEPIVPEARAVLERYRDAVAAFNGAAPNDLGNHVDDLGAPVDAELELLADLDQAPGAFAFALRHLDERDTDLWVDVRVTDQAWFEALAAARLNHPDARADEVVGEAHDELDTSWVFPWEQDGTWRNNPASATWWTATGIGAAATTVDQVWDQWGVPVRGHYRGGSWVSAHGRWQPGWAGRLNPRIGSASTWARLRPWTRGAGRALPFLPGAVQVAQDWDDPTLTTGDRIARTGATTLLEGGGGVVGGFVGAKGGAVAGAALGSVVPGVGTVVGGVAGGIIGGIAGGAIGSEIGGSVNDTFHGTVEVAGDGIDAALDWGGDAVDTVTDFGSDVGGAIADGIGSIF